MNTPALTALIADLASAGITVLVSYRNGKLISRCQNCAGAHPTRLPDFYNPADLENFLGKLLALAQADTHPARLLEDVRTSRRTGRTLPTPVTAASDDLAGLVLQIQSRYGVTLNTVASAVGYSSPQIMHKAAERKDKTLLLALRQLLVHGDALFAGGAQ